MNGKGLLAAHYLPGITSLPGTVPDASVVAIDIPIGLPESGRRGAELAARSVLGLGGTPCSLRLPRAVLEAATHAEATAASARLTGFGVSQQSFALAPKLREVDTWVPQAPYPVYEVRPEISFAVLLGAPASAPKKSWAGMCERRRALEGAGLTLDHIRGDAVTRAAVDDMLDARVAAWSARRIARGQALMIPDPAPTGPDSRPVAVWA